MWKTFIWKIFCQNCWKKKLENFEKKKFNGEKEKHYCHCKSIYNEDETWIGCDSEISKWEWFHLLTCINLKQVPKGNWYCPACRKKGSRTTKKMKIAKRKGWLRPIYNCHAIIYSQKFIPLTHICPMFHFWNPRKHKKTLSFSCVFGGSKNVTLGSYGIR